MKTARFGSLFETATQFLNEIGLKFGDPRVDELESGGRHFIIPSNVNLENGAFCFYVHGNEDNGILGINIRHCTFAPGERRDAVAELITRINYGLTVGSFVMDYTDGEVLFKTTVDIDGMNLGFAVLRNLLYCCVSMMDLFAPAIEQVIAGESTPERALTQLEAK